jgi:hypothetical protein
MSTSALGRLLRMRQEGVVAKTKARSILRQRADGKRSKDPNAPRVQWRAILAGTDEAIDQAELDRLKLAQAKDSWIIRVELYYKLLRLPTLTYEQLAVPLRLAFPIEMLSSRTSIVLDTVVDLFELGLVAYAVLREFELYAAWVMSPATAAASADGNGGRAQAPYTLRRLGLDLLTVGALAASRLTYLIGGPLWPWFVAQLSRLVRIRDLSAYMAQLNADLVRRSNGDGARAGRQAVTSSQRDDRRARMAGRQASGESAPRDVPSAGPLARARRTRGRARRAVPRVALTSHFAARAAAPRLPASPFLLRCPRPDDQRGLLRHL